MTRYLYEISKKFGFLLSLLVCLNITQKCAAQSYWIKGTVIDSETAQPINSVNITRNDNSVVSVTNNDGYFEFFLNGPPSNTDTIVFSRIGFAKAKLTTLALKTVSNIKLEPISKTLDDVVINAKKSNDSLKTRKEYQEDFEYKKAKVTDAIGFLSLNVDILYNSLSKQNKRKDKFRKILISDEQEDYVDRRFSQSLVSKTTGLDGETLKQFKGMYRPTYNVLVKFSDYDLVTYIKNCFQKFQQVNTEVK